MKLGQTPGSDGLYRWCERGVLVTSSAPRYSSPWDKWYLHPFLSYHSWVREILRRDSD
jgi:hypothetical protein